MQRKKILDREGNLTIPSWAIKAIGELSKKSGVTHQKILETALRDGIQTASEPLKAWINYQKSSVEQFCEHLKDTPKDHGAIIPAEAGVAFGDLDFAPDDELREATDFGGLDAFDERPGQRPEVPADHETVQVIERGE